MRINSKVSTWRVVLHAVGIVACFAGFLYGLGEEKWDIAAVFGLLIILGAVEDGRDAILDRLDEGRR